jgi:hypothetical protein
MSLHKRYLSNEILGKDLEQDATYNLDMKRIIIISLGHQLTPGCFSFHSNNAAKPPICPKQPFYPIAVHTVYTFFQ